MARVRNEDNSGERSLIELIVGEHLLLLAFVFSVTFGMFLTYIYFGRSFDDPLSRVPSSAPIAVMVDQNGVAQSAVIQRHRNSPGPTVIGILSGHRGNDAGAVCDSNGTTEADTNLRISEEVIRVLQEVGIDAELLNEYDVRLTPQYNVTAIVSIHADSCNGVAADMSGYKTAVSNAPTSLLLQQCIETQYGAQTGLSYNVNTITDDMTNNHLFNKISETTPAILIETGFLGGDYDLLVNRPNIPAKAIADGIVCFVEQVP